MCIRDRDITRGKAIKIKRATTKRWRKNRKIKSKRLKIIFKKRTSSFKKRTIRETKEIFTRIKNSKTDWKI